MGPILGSLLSTGFYLLIKEFGYETVNPGQDADGQTHMIFDPSTGQEWKIVSVSRPDWSKSVDTSIDSQDTPPESPVKVIVEQPNEKYEDVYEESRNPEAGKAGRRNSTGSM